MIRTVSSTNRLDYYSSVVPRVVSRGVLILAECVCDAARTVIHKRRLSSRESLLEYGHKQSIETIAMWETRATRNTQEMRGGGVYTTFVYVTLQQGTVRYVQQSVAPAHCGAEYLQRWVQLRGVARRPENKARRGSENARAARHF